MDKLEKLRNELGQLADDFTGSPFMEKLSPEKQKEASMVVDSFVHYAINHIGTSPEQWDTSTINEVCLHYVPGKVAAEPATFECYSEVLILFFQFLKDKGILADIEELELATEAISLEIPKKAADPKNWHMAKSRMMPAMESGLDLTNKADMNNYMQQQNSQRLLGGHQSLPSRVRIKAAKNIGRNEKVDVQYEDGTVKKGVKYKKVIRDIELGKCSIL